MGDFVHVQQGTPGNMTAAAARAAAIAAVNQGDLFAAAQAWELLRGLQPDHPVGFVGGVAALQSLNRYAEAESLACAGLAQFPENFELLVAQAQTAARARDWPVAEARWRVLLARYPDRPRVTLGVAEALIQQGRFDAAEGLLVTALLYWPEDLAIAEALARVAVGRGDWADARRRWSAIARRFPASQLAWHGMAFAELKRGDLVAAEIQAAQGVERFPAFPPLLSVHASVATTGRDWQEAGIRWRRLRNIAPFHAEAWVQEAHALRSQRRESEAAALLTEAEAAIPANPAITGMRAELASAAEQWPEASRLLNILAAANAGDKRLQQRAFEATWRAIGSDDVGDAARAMAPSQVPLEDRQALMLRFESIGRDSEFAMVQRYFGAEPLGLLRWTEISTDGLTAALLQKLDGIGEPDNTRLTLGGDYKIRDHRYGLTMHTFVKDEQVDRHQFFAAQCRRTQFLRREFLEELQEAEKIFVYKSSGSDPGRDVERLHAAVKARGGAALLYVRSADGAHRDGTVEALKPGLLVGYLEHIYDGKDTPTIVHAGWVELARKAVRIIDGSDVAATLPLRELMLRFESMGNNCEFGLVQRHFGAEPLGLLRWTLTTLPQLTQAIEDGFPGVGDPDKTELFAGDDLRTVDHRFGLTMRTFVRADQVDRESFLAEHCRRTRILREQLLTDIASGCKVFVHKTDRLVSLNEVGAMHAAMRNIGPVRLLHVRPADTEHASGTVTTIAPGFTVGRLDKLTAGGGGWSIAHDAWLDLCRNVATCS